VDIFVDPPNDVFPRRWRPPSPAAVTIVATSDGSSDSTLGRVVEAHRRFRETTVVS
jgi:hypothetical protein